MEISLFVEAWNEVAASKILGGLRLVNLNMPFEVYCTISKDAKKGVFIASKYPLLSKSESINSYGISFFQHAQGDLIGYYLFANEELEHEFHHLLKDVLGEQYYLNFKSTPIAIKCFHDRVKNWKLFFKNRAAIGREQIQGVFGELALLKKILSENVDHGKIIEGWKSPSEGIVDYNFSGAGIAIEIKTFNRGSNPFITVSSLEQLSDIPEVDLYLGIVCVADNDNGISIRHVAEEILEILPELSEKVAFKEQLRIYGFQYELLSSFDKYLFECLDCGFYLVDEKFPRIQRKDCHRLVRNAKYELDINSLPAENGKSFDSILKALEI
jgi:hypothetical protein